jgi:hypothetical protein
MGKSTRDALDCLSISPSIPGDTTSQLASTLHHCIPERILARVCHEIPDCGKTPCIGKRRFMGNAQPIARATARPLGAPGKLEDENGRELVRLSRWLHAIGLRDVAGLVGTSAQIGEAHNASAMNYRQHVSVPVAYNHIEEVSGLNTGLIKEALPLYEATGWGVVVAHGVRGNRHMPTRIDCTCPADLLEAVKQAKRVDDKRRRHGRTPKVYVASIDAPGDLVSNPVALEMKLRDEESEEPQIQAIQRQPATQRPPNRPLSERTAPGDAVKAVTKETVRLDDSFGVPNDQAVGEDCRCIVAIMGGEPHRKTTCPNNWLTMTKEDRKDRPYLRPGAGRFNPSSDETARRNAALARRVRGHGDEDDVLNPDERVNADDALIAALNAPQNIPKLSPLEQFKLGA